VHESDGSRAGETRGGRRWRCGGDRRGHEPLARLRPAGASPVVIRAWSFCSARLSNLGVRARARFRATCPISRRSSGPRSSRPKRSGGRPASRDRIERAATGAGRARGRRTSPRRRGGALVGEVAALLLQRLERHRVAARWAARIARRRSPASSEGIPMSVAISWIVGAVEPLLEPRRCRPQLRDDLHHVGGDAHRPRGVGERAPDRLLDPPRAVGREPALGRGIEALHRATRPMLPPR